MYAAPADLNLKTFSAKMELLLPTYTSELKSPLPVTLKVPPKDPVPLKTPFPVTLN